MNKILISILTLTALCGNAFSQEGHFTNATEGSALNYIVYDAKGKEKISYTVSTDKVEGSGDDMSITTTMHLESLGLKPMTATTVIKNGSLESIDGLGGSANGPLNLKVEGFVPNIPSRLEVGQNLGTGDFTITNQGNPPFTMTGSVLRYEVVAHEEVTTPAGTFNCWCLETEVTAKMLGMNVTTVSKAWYSKGVGLVKMENYSGKKGKLQSTRLLTATEGL